MTRSSETTSETTSQTARVLVVDDDEEMTFSLATVLEANGYGVQTATSGAGALDLLPTTAPDAVLADVNMQGMSGLKLLQAVRAIEPDLPVLVMTAFSSIDNAVLAVKLGAYHYFAKPLKTDELLLFLRRAIEHYRLRLSHAELLRQAQARTGLRAIVGRSAVITRLLSTIARVAESSAAVLITGESGTGKELVAHALHTQGPRADRPFVPVNCSAIPGTLLESELFGHEKGAFTGALKSRTGLAVKANGGTLFLDEVGELPLDLQPKLLRLLQEGEVRPVGSDGTVRVDVRVLAATNRDLRALIVAGRFREDLYYRLNVIPVQLPPLRQRLDDLPALAEHLLERIRKRHPRLEETRIDRAAIDAMARYDWPGNVRELENAIERAATLCSNELMTPSDFAFLLPQGAVGHVATTEGGAFLPLREMEQRYVQRVLESVGGNRTRAAKILGVDVSTLYRMSRRNHG